MESADNTFDIEELARQAAAAAQALLDQRNAIHENIAKTIEGKLTSRMGNRKIKENQWLEAMRLYLGSLASYNIISNEYPLGVPSHRAMLHSPETNIVRNKCETAIAQTMAFQFAAGDKNWDLRPPQAIDVDNYDMDQIQGMMPQGSPPLSPEEVVAVKIDLMEREMEQHLENTRYGPESRKAGFDRAILGTGVMKAPTNSTKVKKVYQKMQTSSGQIIRVPKMVPENVPCIYRVNPWYWFPDDSVTDIKQAEDTIEVHPMSKTQLKEMLANPAFMSSQIEEVLKEEPTVYVNSPFNDPAYLTQGINLMKEKYLVLEYHGPLKRTDLEAMGKAPVNDTEGDSFFVEVWVVNSKIIRLEFSNLEGCYRCPYVAVSWEPDPASIFGFGIPMLVRDQQRVVNDTFKMMIDNAGVSAGPQVIIDTTRISPAEGGLECTPWKVWYTKEYGVDVGDAIKFFIPDNAFQGLSAMFSLSMSLADMESSIPNLSMNMGGPTGAADSATGMAIVQQNASSPLFYKSEQWDDNITKPLIEMLYDWEMQYNPKDEIKTTCDIDVQTSTAFLQSSLNQQKLEKLLLMINQPNSPITPWVNIDEAVQAALLDMHLPSKTIVKTPQQVAQDRANQPPPPPDPNLIKAQAEMQKVQNDKARIQIEAQQQQIDAQQKMQQAQMQYEAQMRTDEVRAREAEASVIKAQYDFEAQMAILASQDQQHREKIVAGLQSDRMHLQTQKFLAGGEMAMRARDQDLKKQELEVKKKKGTGI